MGSLLGWGVGGNDDVKQLLISEHVGIIVPSIEKVNGSREIFLLTISMDYSVSR
jgi:hypothetical protein